MIAMAKDKGLKVYYRTTPKLRGSHELLMGALRATDTYASRKKSTSKDALINALLLWAIDRDPDELAKELEPYVVRFKVIWDEVLAADEPSDGAPNADAIGAKVGRKPRSGNKTKNKEA
jgi:hypothetical protein